MAELVATAIPRSTVRRDIGSDGMNRSPAFIIGDRTVAARKSSRFKAEKNAPSREQRICYLLVIMGRLGTAVRVASLCVLAACAALDDVYGVPGIDVLDSVAQLYV